MQDNQNTTTTSGASSTQSQFDNNPNDSSNPPNPTDVQTTNSNTTPAFNDTTNAVSSEIQNEVSSPLTNSDFGNTNQAQNTQQSVVTAPHAPQKYGGKKVIATIFGILLLVGGVTVGVYLVQQQQDLRREAASGSACDQSPDCVLVDDAPNIGSKTVERQIIYVDITDQEYHRFEPGETDDGCRRVNISGNTVSWERYGDGPNCKDVSNVQIWMGNEQPTNTPTLPPGETPTATPVITEPPSTSAECSNVKPYDSSWNLLSQVQIGQLEVGTIIRFTVSGTASSGSFDKARFSVNSVSLGETTLKKPGSEEFYIKYTIPSGVTGFNVDAQIHHSELGWF